MSTSAEGKLVEKPGRKVTGLRSNEHQCSRTAELPEDQVGSCRLFNVRIIPLATARTKLHLLIRANWLKSQDAKSPIYGAEN